jgi:cytochrome b
MSGLDRTAEAAAASDATATVRVWDPVVRLVHWSLAAAVAVAWLTREGGGIIARVHEIAGYLALALITARVAWGFAGSEHARFGSFVRSPRATWAYSRTLFAGREERHLGHNPLGAWMILALIVTTAVCGLSGWLYVTEAYWGVEWVADLHEATAVLLLGLIALHVAGVVFTSWRHRENLVAALIHGRKAVEAGTISPNRLDGP